MTLKSHLLNKRSLRAGLPLAGLGIAAAALSGCGGASTNTGAASVPTPNSGPVVYGVNALALESGANTQGETSGIAFTPSGSTAPVGAVIAATGYQTVTGAGPLPAYQATFPNAGGATAGVPLGFTSGGNYYNVSSPVAAIPTNYAGTLVFGAYISTGVKNTVPVDLNTSSVVLTSSEAPTFSQQLTFDPNFGSGVLAQAQYKTAPFPMPAFLQTTGLHNLHTTISDVAGQTSTTDFSVLALAPTDSAALVTVNFTNASSQTVGVGGAIATITNPLPNIAAYKDYSAPTGAAALPLTTSYADAQGVVLLFAAPGTQTVTATGIDPFDGKTPVSGSVQVALTAGAVTTTASINTTIVPATTTTAAAIARAKAHPSRVQH